MEKSELAKQKIIAQTIALIKESNGDTEKVTIRKIAERAKVSTGLMNHYFESKEKLLELCVQTIINGVVMSFKPELPEDDAPGQVLKSVAKQVMDFLMDNQQISRISILGDLSAPKEKDNTMGTALGFSKYVPGDALAKARMADAFMLTAILQESFLRKDVLKSMLGIDLYDKTERDAYIDRIVEKIIK